MEAERLKSLAEVERSVAVRQNIGVAFVTFDDASVASRFVIRSCLLFCTPSYLRTYRVGQNIQHSNTQQHTTWLLGGVVVRVLEPSIPPG